MSGLAIVAGRGILPRLLAEDCVQNGRTYAIVRFGKMRLEWLTDHPVIEAEFESFGALFDAMRDAGCDAVVFAGGMDRPNIDLTRLDAKTREILPKLGPSIGKGDDKTLRTIAEIFETEGFGVTAAQQLLSGLLAEAGVMGEIEPSPADQADMTRAAQIATALGAVDVGQGAVVAQGLCLGVESLQGTDAMLGFVAQSAGNLRPDPNGAGGVLFKGPKPGQDLRMDLPAIGPSTLQGAADAGLAGVAVRAEMVLILDRDETIDRANRLGLFLIGLPEAEN